MADAPTHAQSDLIASALTAKHTIRGERLRDFAAFALILGFALALCAPVLVGRVPVASDTISLWAPWSKLPHEPVHNEVLADSSLQSLSWLVYSRETIAAGEWPLWDPYSFSGSSYASNSQNQLYYPLTWLRWLLPLPLAVQLLSLFNICLAGWGMYVLLRWLGASRVGSLLAALAFAGSGMMQLSLEVMPVASVYCWLPFMLYAMDRALQGKSWLWVAVSTLMCALQAVAGNLQWVLYSYFAIGCWILWRAVEQWRSGGYRVGIKTVGRGALVLLGGLALAAIHLVPFFELISQTTRTQSRASSNSWPLSYLLRMVMPQYFNTAVPGVGPPMVFNDLWNVGILPLLLAAVALVTRTRRYVWFWAGMGLFAILVTFGIGPFLYVRWLPGLQALLPMRIGYLLIFSVALLAGLGYDAWLRMIVEKQRASTILLLTLAFLLGAITLWAWVGQLGESDVALNKLKGEQVLRGFLLGTLSIIALAIPLLASALRLFKERAKVGIVLATLSVLALDLLTIAPGYNTFVKAEELVPPAPSVAWLKAQGDGGRIMGVDSGAVTFNPNTQSLYGFPSVDGYDAFHWRRYEEYWSIVDPSVRPVGRSNIYSNIFLRPQAYTSTVAALLNVCYVAAAADLAVPAGWTRVYSDEIEIYRNPSALPRAFLVGDASVMPSQQVREWLASSDFDPRKSVLLEQEESPPTIGPAAVGSTGEASISQYRRNSVTVQVNVTQPSWLVLADPNYPGWSATIDGREQQVYTAYYLLRAVPLTSGHHIVEFRYWPTTYWPAILISVSSLFAVISVIVLSSTRSRRVRDEVPSKDEIE